ncbi:hypothetical protein RDI58_013559 [Solanum bulbocastanum]|uniref:Uncharacterized protein n=1 Tax=Solanum bulbocastanum TaxID=147425 RepID=A0AAN8YE38_SOLBU
MEKKAYEALINTFCEITSSSKSQALFFLESHNFDLDSAVSTFLENSSLPSAGPGTASADPVSPSDSQSYSPSHSESSSPSSRSRSPSPPPPPSLSSKRKRKPSSNAYNLRSSRPRNNAAAVDVADTVGGGRRSLRRRPTTGSESNSDEPQEANTGGEKREANQIADKVASLSHQLEDAYICTHFLTLPSQIRCLLNTDRWQMLISESRGRNHSKKEKESREV